MKIIYESFDGKQFTSERECREYEGKISQPIMYDNDGNKSNTRRCLIVNLQSTVALTFFINQLNEENYPTEGLNSPGTYLWDNDGDKFIYITPQVKKAFQHYLKDNEEGI